jgi:hypothetical protein
MSTLEVNKITPSTGTDITLGDSGDTFTIPSGVTLTNSGTASGFGANTPAFRMFMSANQTLSANTETKIQMNTTSGNSNTGWDTNSAFDTSNYKFTVPSGEGGKYYFKGSVLLEYADALNEYGRMMFYVNGAEKANFRQGMNSSGLEFSLTLSAILNLSANDYVELYAIHTHSSSRTIDKNSRYTWFEAYKLIGA